MAEPTNPVPGAKVLLQGLELLRLLAQSNGPVSATALAQITGQHPSTVSRLLSGLVKAGYLRKPDYHSFSVDLGLATLFGRMRTHFPLTTKPRAVLAAQAAKLPGMRLSLATLHEHQLVYWLAVDAGQEPADLLVGGYPLHLSSIALRILLDLPAAEAESWLAVSRRWHGWDQPTAAVPGDAPSVLAAARGLMQYGCLPLSGWQAPGHLSAAVPVRSPDGRPLVLALSGHPSDLPAALAHLQAARVAVEHVLFPGDPS
jgi:DNA-binding IclR family transcriptional regulator